MHQREVGQSVVRTSPRFGWVVRCAGVLAVPLLLAACGPSAAEQAATNARALYYSGQFDRAARDLAPFAEKTDENFALQNARLGSAYLGAQRVDQAEAAFLRSYEVINAVGVNAGGRSLGAVLVDEKIRVWKGEPFERAMVNFYLGLTYSLRGDLNNARAAYENALFKLREYDDTTDKQKNDAVESDFALALIMLGRSWQRLGRDDLANANFARAVALRPDLIHLADPEVHRRSNVLLVVDFGVGPQRNTEFDGSILTFYPTPAQAGPIPIPRVLVNGQPYDFRGADVPPVDLLALAQQRRWQSIDTIRTTKSAIGTGLIGAGAVMGMKGANSTGSRQRTDLMVAGGLLAAGLLLKATSQADVREWGTLPRTTFVLPMNLAAGQYTLTIQGGDGSSHTLSGLPVFELPNDRTFYVRMLPFTQSSTVYGAAPAAQGR